MSREQSPAGSRPTFNDPNLRAAFDEAAPLIEGFTQRLDDLSKDIRGLEAYLERSAVRIPIEVKIDDSRGQLGEYIAWQQGEPDRFRVIYFRRIHVDEIDEYGDTDRTVLIEAPVAVRVRAKAALSALVSEIGRAASLGEATKAADDSDIPF